MSSRWARRLTGLYPRAWRARYGEEFLALLEEQPWTITSTLDVLGSAVWEHITRAGFPMDTCQRSVVLMTWASLAAVAAGVNFYFSIDDTPLTAALRLQAAHPSVLGVVDTASWVAVIAVFALAIPITIRMLREAVASRRWDAISRIAVPFVAAALTIAWLAGAGLWAHTQWGGAWVPLPWDVGGDWVAPADWPPLTVRWLLSTATLTLLLAGLLGSAISVGQAIARTDFSSHRVVWLRIPVVSLAGSIVVMALGVAAWGLFAEREASAAFHGNSGGFFASTTLASWLASALVFVTAAVMAVRGARLAIAIREPSTTGATR